MIDFGKILKRAWQILWSYRVLWIFGLLLAITAGRGGGGSSGPQIQFSGRDWSNARPWPPLEEFSDWAQQNLIPLFEHPEQYIGTYIWIGVGFLLFILIVSAIMALIRYPSETAVLRMVDDHEQTGQKVSFRQGWRLGWSRRAFRLWVIDLVINLPVLLLVAVIVGVGFAIYFAVEGSSRSPSLGAGEAGSVVGVVAAIGFFFVFLFFFVIGMAFLGLLRQFFARKAALEGASMGESFRQGWQMFRHNWKSGLLMWLVMLGVGIGVGILGFILFFLLIPVYLILLIPAILTAALPVLIGFGIAALFAPAPLAWVIGILLGLPLFFTVLFLPLIAFSGLYQVYSSSVWTLAYREMKALNGGRVEPAVADDKGAGE
jgi:hypothetical protein